MKKFNLQLFAEPYDGLTAPAINAMAGKNVLLCVWNSDGTNLLGIGGQQDSNVDQEAETSEVASKSETSDGDWQVSIAGMKSWSGECSGIRLTSDGAQAALNQAFRESQPVCLKWIDKQQKKGIYAGFAYVTSISFEAPTDDVVTTSFSFTGTGKLHDLIAEPLESDTMPSGVQSNTASSNQISTGGSTE